MHRRPRKTIVGRRVPRLDSRAHPLNPDPDDVILWAATRRPAKKISFYSNGTRLRASHDDRRDVKVHKRGFTFWTRIYSARPWRYAVTGTMSPGCRRSWSHGGVGVKALLHGFTGNTQRSHRKWEKSHCPLALTNTYVTLKADR